MFGRRQEMQATHECGIYHRENKARQRVGLR